MSLISLPVSVGEKKGKVDTWHDSSLIYSTYRSSPQVIRGKPVHLTEFVDGAVPTGATGGGASQSGGCKTSRRRRHTFCGCQAFIRSDCSFQTRRMGLVVVRDGKVAGLHCSGPELHAGQAAIIHHDAGLADCQLYFSRRPCATCLKMIINGERSGGRGRLNSNSIGHHTTASTLV